jgi:hypothetical protein
VVAGEFVHTEKKHMSNYVQEFYEPLIRPARRRFGTGRALSAFFDIDSGPMFLELFLIHFCSHGVALTQPVEDWLMRAGRRCEEVGLAELGQALCGHAKEESGHHVMMIADTRALVARWNARRALRFEADQLLARPLTRGGQLYRQVHEDNIAGPTPFGQIAIEYEIEMVPVLFGPQLLEVCQTMLGPDILSALSFLQEHITLDVGHTRFNEMHLERLLQKNRDYVMPVVRAGEAVLEAYATFLHDCVQLARGHVLELAAAGLGARPDGPETSVRPASRRRDREQRQLPIKPTDWHPDA